MNDSDAGDELNKELQAGVQAHETRRRLAAMRRSGEVMPSAAPPGANTVEFERLVRNIKTGEVDKQEVQQNTTASVRKKRNHQTLHTATLGLLGIILMVGCAYATKSISVQAEGKRSYIAGRNFLREGKHELAISSFGRSLRLMPENYDAYFYRAMSFLQTGQFEEALQDFDKVLKYNPERIAALNGKSLAMLELRDSDRAILFATVALKLHPKEANALLLRSISYARAERYKEALADCDAVIDSNCKRALPQAYANRAFVFFKTGQTLAAIRDYRHAVKEAPKIAVLYASLAQCLKKTGDIEGAIDECKRCLKLDPKDLATLLLLGECLLETNNAKEALKYLDKAVALYNCAETLQARADAYIALGNYKLAYNDLECVLHAHPRDIDALKKRSICRAEVLKSEGSATVKQMEEKVPALSSGSVQTKLAEGFEGLVNQGYSLLQAGSYASAVEALSKAVRLKPENATARRYLAYALHSSGDDNNASAQFAALARLQRLDPNDLSMYAKTLIAARQFDSASKVYRGLLRVQPYSVEARTGIIQTYLARKEYQQALDEAAVGIRMARSESEKMTYLSLHRAAQTALGR